MIRKKREITQVDLFGEWTQADAGTHPGEASVVRIYKTERIRPENGKSNLQDQLQKQNSHESTELILFDDLLPPEHTERATPKNDPQQKSQTVDTILSTETDDDNLINKDFADGFYVPSGEREKVSSDTFGTRRKKRRRILKIMLTVLLFTLATLMLNWNEWIVQSPMFILKNIEVRGEDLISREEIIQWSGLKTGTLLGQIDAPNIEEQLMRKPFFKEVTVSKRYPSSLVITVTERRPIALIVMDELHPMDENGFILPKLKAVRSYNLPLITGLRAALKTGSELRTPEIQPIRRFLALAREHYPILYFEISEVEYTKQALRIYMNHLSFPLLIDPDALERSLFTLDVVSDYLKKNNPGRSVREVDLRYDQKVIIRDK